MNSSWQAVARTVECRLALVAWCEMLARTCAPTFAVLTVGAGLVVWRSGMSPGLWFALLAVVLWIAVVGAVAWFRRPRGVQALAVWDENAARHEAFLSAYCFAALPQRTPAQEAHLHGAATLLETERPKLQSQIPLVWSHRIWVVPLLFVAVASLVHFQPPIAEGEIVEVIDEEARRNAAELSGTLKEEAKSLHTNDAWKEEERKQVEALKQSIDEAADKLKQLDDATPREALSELEQRARAAESLADSLSGSSEKLSSEMLDEMARHTDTADLADALRADEAEQIAQEANKLADKLAQPDASLEERKRVADAFKKTMEKANENDKKNEAGKKLDEANNELQKKQPGLASKKLRELAQSKQKLQQRQKSAQQLQQLAKNLRRAGQQIFGRNTSGLQRLAQNQQQQQLAGGPQKLGTPRQIPLLQPSPAGQQGQGQQAAGQMALGQPQAGQQGQPPGANPAGTMLVPAQAGGPPPTAAIPIPGSGNQQGGQQMAGGQPGGQPGGAVPIPGTGGQQGAGQQGGGQQGSGQGSQPGSGAGQGAGYGSGGAPVPGSGGGGQGSGQGGGLQAGVGTAAMGNDPTKAMETTRRGTVQAQVGEQGSSQTRAIDPQQHQEQAQVAARQTAVEFIKVQEEALADEPLPAARRDQVRRYFNSLRQQLSNEPQPTAEKGTPQPTSTP